MDTNLEKLAERAERHAIASLKDSVSDEPWVSNRGRAAEVAAAYFTCAAALRALAQDGETRG